MPSSLLASPFVHSTVTIRVAVAHGQRLVRAGLRAILEREGEIAVVEAASGEEAVAVARRLRPNVVLLDVHLPGLGCVEATRQILAGPSVAVTVLTASETDARVFATLRAGAAGLLLDRDDWRASTPSWRTRWRSPGLRRRWCDGLTPRSPDRPRSAGGGATVGRLSPYAFAYEACDVPAGMTIREFRASRAAADAGEVRIASLGRVCAAVRACLGRAGAVA